MSRSYKKPIIKDKPRNFKASTYYRKVRRAIKIAVSQFNEIIPLAKELVNQYDYCDRIWNMEDKDDADENKIKYSRK